MISEAQAAAAAREAVEREREAAQTERRGPTLLVNHTYV